jgi:hypothetical protein
VLVKVESAVAGEMQTSESVAALPPDVRKGSAFPKGGFFQFEAMPRLFIRGIASNGFLNDSLRKGKAFPHIGWQSHETE